MRRVFIGLAALLVAGVLLPVATLAQENATTTETNATTEAEESTSGSGDETRQAERQARINAYKQQVTDRLSAAEGRRIAGVCKAAQTIVERLQTNLAAVLENRRTTYNDVSTKLDDLVAKLQAASVDTTALEAAIAEMESQAATIVAGIETYQTTLTDLGAMDCEADPDGFQAALTAAREQRATLVTQSQALRAYVADTIKPILTDIRASLATDSTESEA